MNFWDQYKHPEWQKKRLEILDKAEWCCQKCYSSEDELHVHHRRYIKGRKVWEYSANELIVLCEQCHKETHKDQDDLKELIASLHPEAIRDVIMIFSGYAIEGIGPIIESVDAAASIINRGEMSIYDKRKYVAGAIAAVVSQRLTSLDEIVEFFKAIESIGEDGEINIKIHNGSIVRQ